MGWIFQDGSHEKFLQGQRHGHFSRLPGTLLRSVAFPINQVSRLTPLAFRIKDFMDDILIMILNLHYSVAEEWLYPMEKRVRHILPP